MTTDMISPTPATMFWRRLDTQGHDACWLEQVDGKWLITGATIFRHALGPTVLNYRVVCSRAWTTMSGHITGRLGNRTVQYEILRDDSGWTLNGERVPELEAMVDLDFSFTPATNFIQLQRVAIPLGRKTSIDVAWFDIDTAALGPLPQIYERLSERALAYAAPSVDYAGTLELASNGFISHYPGLWRADQAP